MKSDSSRDVWYCSIHVQKILSFARILLSEHWVYLAHLVLQQCKTCYASLPAASKNITATKSCQQYHTSNYAEDLVVRPSSVQVLNSLSSKTGKNYFFLKIHPAQL